MSSAQVITHKINLSLGEILSLLAEDRHTQVRIPLKETKKSHIVNVYEVCFMERHIKS